MANWFGTTRSNYFRVKDKDAFLEMMKGFEADVIFNDDKVGFISKTFSGDIPSIFNGDDLDQIYLTDVIHEHLADNSVCVVQTIGAEKARYLTGESVAILPTGEKISVSINDIYKKIVDEAGSDFEVTEAIS